MSGLSNCIFFFINTAATDVDTYLHTLYLHVALPISPTQGYHKGSPPVRSGHGRAPAPASPAARPACASPGRRRCPRGPPAMHARSEAPTSELQSLTRNSYAVFCLKKKTPNHNTDSQHYYFIHYSSLSTHQYTL